MPFYRRAAICLQVAEGILDQLPDPSLRYEVLVAALGEVISAAPYGVRPFDLHSYGDAAVFNVRGPLAVGGFIRRVLNRDQEGQTPIQPEHPAITKLKAKLCPQAATPGAGSVAWIAKGNNTLLDFVYLCPSASMALTFSAIAFSSALPINAAIPYRFAFD